MSQSRGGLLEHDATCTDGRERAHRRMHIRAHTGARNRSFDSKVCVEEISRTAALLIRGKKDARWSGGRQQVGVSAVPTVDSAGETGC